MDPVIVAVISVGASLAALVLSGQRGIRTELRSLSERLTTLDQRVSGLDQRLSRLEGAFSIAFGLPRQPEVTKTDPDRRA